MHIRARKVGRLVRRMRTQMPWLQEQDLSACRGWAEADVIGASLFAAIMKGGVIHIANGDVAGRRVVNDWRQINCCNWLTNVSLE
jgi:hypothetical protein